MISYIFADEKNIIILIKSNVVFIINKILLCINDINSQNSFIIQQLFSNNLCFLSNKKNFIK